MYVFSLLGGCRVNDMPSAGVAELRVRPGYEMHSTEASRVVRLRSLLVLRPSASFALCQTRAGMRLVFRSIQAKINQDADDHLFLLLLVTKNSNSQ
jgi:hypothetical protein